MANSIFSSSEKKKEETEFKEKVDVHSKAILDVISRQKDLETTLDLINEKIELLDHNTIKVIKQIRNEIKELRTDLLEVKSEIKEIKSFNQKVIKQLKITPTIDEVKKLEKYIDLWNPMDFITREEMKKEQKKFKKDLIEAIKKTLGK